MTGHTPYDQGAANGSAPEPACLDDAAYVLGALPPRDRLTYERHLAGCARCQDAVARLSGLPALLGTAAVEDLPAAPGTLPQAWYRAGLTDGPPAAWTTGPNPGALPSGSAPAAGPAGAVPAELLPGLLRAVSARRRRQRWLLGGTTGLAAACAAALVMVLLRPAAGAAPAAAEQVQLAAVPLPPGATTTGAPPTTGAAGPVGPAGAATVDLSVALTDKQWGTSITVNCRYLRPAGVEKESTGYGYRLFLLGRNDRAVEAGSWLETSGATSTVVTATSWHRSEITGLEVRSPTGQVLFRGAP